MTNTTMTFFEEALQALHLPEQVLAHTTVQGSAQLASAFPVTDFAVGAIGAAGTALAQLIKAQSHSMPQVVIDR